MKGQSKNTGFVGHAWIRILATSDVHAHLRALDYTRDCPASDWGLTRTASAIEAARAESPCSILLDNGDFLQGTPLADLFATAGKNGQTHPVLAAMKALDYDVINLGNHEFNYGLDQLRALISKTDIPVLCANVSRTKRERQKDLFAPTALIHRNLEDAVTKEIYPLSIGVTGLLPTQIMKWDGAHLLGRIEAHDMVETASYHIPKLREAGADLIVVLAHTGIDRKGIVPNAENAALALAQVPGIDALVTGHTHQLFPNPGTLPSGGIDHTAGTLYGVPTVMPGYRGSHLGIVDLCLERRANRWVVAHHRSEARSVANSPEHAGIMTIVEHGHQHTLAYVGKPIGQTNRPIHSYLGLIHCDLATQIVGEAQRAAVQNALAETDHGDLPVLSAVAPYQTGGRAGPMAYVDIAEGALTMRNATSLYPSQTHSAPSRRLVRRSATGWNAQYPALNRSGAMAATNPF